jgi:hypothetical protein
LENFRQIAGFPAYRKISWQIGGFSADWRNFGRLEDFRQIEGISVDLRDSCKLVNFSSIYWPPSNLPKILNLPEILQSAGNP